MPDYEHILIFVDMFTHNHGAIVMCEILFRLMTGFLNEGVDSMRQSHVRGFLACNANAQPLLRVPPDMWMTSADGVVLTENFKSF